MSFEATSRGGAYGAYGAVHAGQITAVINNWLSTKIKVIILFILSFNYDPLSFY
jgi:hypothetical protein